MENKKSNARPNFTISRIIVGGRTGKGLKKIKSEIALIFELGRRQINSSRLSKHVDSLGGVRFDCAG